MKKLLFVLAAALLVSAGTSQAGWGWGGGFGWGGGGYCGPRWGGYGWGGPAIGIGFAAPVAVYRPVYYATPAPAYYVRTVTYRTAPAPSSTLMRAQSQLLNLGYYRGSVDGSFGPLTNRAILQYQADYGLPVTGRLDRATLKSLGV